MKLLRSLNVIAFLVNFVSTLPAARKSPKIVGGENAQRHEAPFIISIQLDIYGDGILLHWCGGSLLSAEWILTAAHCYTLVGFPGISMPENRAVAGAHNQREFSGVEQFRQTSTIILHEDFDLETSVGPFDIALAKADSPFNLLSGIVEVVKLPLRNAIPEGFVQLFGWGSISRNETLVFPDILQTVIKPVLTLDECREVLDATTPWAPLHFTNVCTGPLDTEVTACPGDSGGPVVQGNPVSHSTCKTWHCNKIFIIKVELVGLVSWISRFPCGIINAVSVYVRVSAFVDWIEEKTSSLSMNY